jgi:hypothetical protein
LDCRVRRTRLQDCYNGGFMKILHALMRAYAYIYHFLLAAALTGIATVAYLSGVHNINTGGMMSLTGLQLTQCLLGIGLMGIVAVLLAVFGILRFLFPIYAAGAAFTLFRWFFASGYRFGSMEAFQWGIALFVGALGALLCSLLELKAGDRKRSRRI